MDFRRIPFQFTSTDPAKRQAELQKRFGLPANTKNDNMFIDFANPDILGNTSEGRTSVLNSPRLQHRVPVFHDGCPEAMKTSVDSQGSPSAGRKPHVRVIPIEIEGEDTVPKRHRNLSGPANIDKDVENVNGFSWLPDEYATDVRPPALVPKTKPPAGPRERTIPIQVEGMSQNKKVKTTPVPEAKPVNPKTVPKHNGCNTSKVEAPVRKPEPILTGCALSLKKIEGVLEKLRTYHADVEKFTGTVKEKQYRYLDEMLTRLMLELDDIDTMGSDKVRLSRKAAVKQVQASIDLLEAKVTRDETGQASKEEASEKDKPVDGENVEIEGAEINLASTQEENVPSEDGSELMPVDPVLLDKPGDEAKTVEMELCSQEEKEMNLNLDALPSVPVESSTEMQATVEEMELEGADKVCGSAGVGDEVLQVMEMVEDIEGISSIESQPVITTVDSPVKENVAAAESNVVSSMQIEELKDEENVQELPASLTESLIVEMKRHTEEDSSSDAIESSASLSGSAVLEEDTQINLIESVTESSQDVVCENIPSVEQCTKLIANEHSIPSNHTSNVPVNE